MGEIELGFTRALVKAGLCNGQMECVIIHKGGAQSFSEKPKADLPYFFLPDDREVEGWRWRLERKGHPRSTLFFFFLLEKPR